MCDARFPDRGFVRCCVYPLGWALLAVLLTATGASAGVSPVPEYTLRDLGVLPGDIGSSAKGLNDSGEVVGNRGGSRGGPRAFLYSAGTMIDLGAPGNSAEPAGSTAYGINDSGIVVGTTSILSFTTGFIYRSGMLQDLSTRNGSVLVRTSASGINAAGQIVGQSDFGVPDGPYRAALFSGGSTRDLGTLGGRFSAAYAINAAGQIVGQSDVSLGNVHPFLYQNGMMQDLGFPGLAAAINDRGQIVGAGQLSGGSNSHAFLYSNGTVHDLGTLGGTGSQAEGINDRGEVVGLSTITGLSDFRPFLYADGTMYDLNHLLRGAPGYTLTDAAAINASGQIAATALTPSGATHAVLLTPGATAIPLPPAAWAALGALPLVLVGMRFCRWRGVRARPY